MRKVIIAFSLLLFSSNILMADLKPQFSSDVNLLKAEFDETKVVTEKKEQEKKKKSFKINYMKYAPSFMTNDKNTTKSQQKSPTISQPDDVKIIKVSNYSVITKYSLSHKKIKAIRKTKSITRNEIVKISKSIKAKKVLIYVLKNTRYIYFYKN